MGKRRFVYFDMLSIVATLAVVFLHCNGIVHWGPQTPHWSQALLVEVLFIGRSPFSLCAQVQRRWGIAIGRAPKTS